MDSGGHIIYIEKSNKATTNEKRPQEGNIDIHLLTRGVLRVQQVTLLRGLGGQSLPLQPHAVSLLQLLLLLARVLGRGQTVSLTGFHLMWVGLACVQMYVLCCVFVCVCVCVCH
jgi:hypothetical protein